MNKLLKNRILRSEMGAALTQVIISSGLLILVSVASMQIQENISKTQKKLILMTL